MQTNSHLSRLILDQAKKYGDREALIYKDFGGSEWKSYSWNQFSDMVKKVSNALLNLGVKVQENLGISTTRHVAFSQHALHSNVSSFSTRMYIFHRSTSVRCISTTS